jgi:drug/metabolite transporter (DMT)-like permease
MTKNRSNLKGILFLLLAMLIISLQSIAVKGLGGNYPVLEMVVLRNLVALIALAAAITTILDRSA